MVLLPASSVTLTLSAFAAVPVRLPSNVVDPFPTLEQAMLLTPNVFVLGLKYNELASVYTSLFPPVPPAVANNIL